MHIYAPFKTPTGSIVTVHRLRRIEVEASHIHAIIDSYADEGMQAVIWQDAYHLSPDALCPAPFTAAFEWLISSSGPFPGGTLVEDPTALEAARARAWSRIKYEREEVERAGCPTPYGAIDTTDRSLAKLNGSICASFIVPDFKIVWTMADNTLAELDREALQIVGLAVFSFVDAVHQRARALRSFIGDSDDMEALEALRWATPIGGEN